MDNSTKHVFIGMSGGLDSSATLKLLIDQKYKVTGVTFVGLGAEQKPLQSGRGSFLGKPSRKCCSTEEVIAAKNLCYSMGVSHITLDLAKEFQKYVRDPFAQSYINGETPNPCMLCNRYVKLGALVNFARENGADYVAMGHYTGLENVDGEFLLKAGKDKNKDQSYFLALIQPDLLPYLIFPLANKEKDEIRQIIADSDMPISSNKLESQDVCFVDDDYRDYLKTQGVSEQKGTMLLDGKPVGDHKGVAFYALGQRKGLGVAVGRKVFVREINAKDNTLILGDMPRSLTFQVTGLNIFSKHFQDGEWDVQVRYRSERIKGYIKYLDKDLVEVTLSNAQDIISPGQYAVFYKNDYIYGAGRIKKTTLLKD